jgi:phosphoglycolate phosphatase
MKLALFDVDGTLVDSRAMIVAAMHEAFAAEGLAAPPPPRLLAVVGLSLTQAMRRLVPGAEETVNTRLAEAYKSAFWSFRASGAHSEDLFPGALDLLRVLRQRGDVLLGIATGKSRRGVAHLLETHGLQDWFATMQTADDNPSKPDPAMVARAIAESGADAGSTAMIGDTAFDIAMARAAGVRAIGVTWGNHPASELQLAGAHDLVNDFKSLGEVLDVFWQAGGGHVT